MAADQALVALWTGNAHTAGMSLMRVSWSWEERPSEVGGAAAAERWASELTGLPMPDRCGHLYWIVSPD